MTSKEFVQTAIREITIENFRGIDRLSLSFVGLNDLPTDIVVLAGPNGCGKTTVLEACLIAAEQKGLLRGSSAAQAIRSGADDYKISACLETPRGRIRAEHRSATSRYQKDGGVERSESYFRIPCAYFSSWRAPKFVGPVPITSGKRGKRPSETEENRLWVVKQHLVNAKAYAFMGGGPVRAMDKESRYAAVTQKLDETWRLFHPGSDQHFSVEPAGDDPDAGFDVFLMGPGEQRVALDSLSSGELELFNFVGWMLATKFEGGIICIDEPELHLDPQWHALILRALRKLQPNSQFIVATHSPEVYESVLSFERHFLVPPEDPRAKAWGIQQQTDSQA